MTQKMNETQADAYVTAAAAAVNLPVDPAHRPGVVAFVRLAAEMADILDEADLGAHEAALAPVFRLPDAE